MTRQKIKNNTGTIIYSLGIILIVAAFVVATLFFFNSIIIKLLTLISWVGLFSLLFLISVIVTIYSKKYKALYFNICIFFLTISVIDTVMILWPEIDLKQKFTSVFVSEKKTTKLQKENIVELKVIADSSDNKNSKFTKKDSIGLVDKESGKIRASSQENKKNVPNLVDSVKVQRKWLRKSKDENLYPPSSTEDYSKDIQVYYVPSAKYFNKSDILGYAPGKSRYIRTYSTYKNDLKLFDVHYTFDKNGLRVSPPYYAEPNSRSVLFFGCSLTFGYGLDDKQTLPFQLGLQTDGKYKIYNFAFNGYGTHQMVSMLEHKRVDSIVKVPPKYAFYIAIPDHINRMMNKHDWDEHGPKYILDDNGNAVYKGHFDDYALPIPIDWKEKLKIITEKSFVLKTIKQKGNGVNSFTKYEVDLFTAMIIKANKLVKQKYPECEFHFIYWSNNSLFENEMYKKLEKEGIVCHLTKDILENPNNCESNCIKYPYEVHPNAETNGIFAEYIMDMVINKHNGLSAQNVKNNNSIHKKIF